MALPYVMLPNGHIGLYNNEVYSFALADTAGGAPAAAPAGDVVTPAAGGQFAASLQFSMSADGTRVLATPMVAQSDAGNGGGGISLLLTDSAGLTEDTATKNVLFDIITPPLVPATDIGIDLTNVTTTSQPTPTNPGP